MNRTDPPDWASRNTARLAVAEIVRPRDGGYSLHSQSLQTRVTQAKSVLPTLCDTQCVPTLQVKHGTGRGELEPTQRPVTARLDRTARSTVCAPMYTAARSAPPRPPRPSPGPSLAPYPSSALTWWRAAGDERPSIAGLNTGAVCLSPAVSHRPVDNRVSPRPGFSPRDQLRKNLKIVTFKR